MGFHCKWSRSFNQRDEPWPKLLIAWLIGAETGTWTNLEMRFLSSFAVFVPRIISLKSERKPYELNHVTADCCAHFTNWVKLIIASSHCFFAPFRIVCNFGRALCKNLPSSVNELALFVRTCLGSNWNLRFSCRFANSISPPPQYDRKIVCLNPWSKIKDRCWFFLTRKTNTAREFLYNTNETVIFQFGSRPWYDESRTFLYLPLYNGGSIFLRFIPMEKPRYFYSNAQYCGIFINGETRVRHFTNVYLSSFFFPFYSWLIDENMF